MSSSPSTRPSYFPSSSSTTPEQREPSTSPERRSTAPREQNCRRLFDKIWDYVLRYSSDPLEKDEWDNPTMSDMEVATFLEKETEELKEQDPLIKLRLLEKSDSLDTVNNNLMVGVYRLVSPSIKELNDNYLGPNQTDDFIEDLNRSITKELAENSGQTLNTNFKRGIFVMNFTELVNGSGRPYEEVLQERIEAIHKKAKHILLTHIDRRIKALEDKQRSLPKILEADHFRGPQAAEKLLAHLDKIDESIASLSMLDERIRAGDEKAVDIAFGFDKLKSGPEESYLAIRNAECAANMASLRNGTKRHVQMYSDQQLLMEITQGLHLLGTFDMFTHDEKGKGIKIKKEWEDFFRFDEKRQVRMQPGMIKTYRRLDKYRNSREYLDLPLNERRKFDDKIRKFGTYYARMNIVDVLKNFQKPEFPEYLDKIEKLTDLITQAEQNLNAETEDSKVREQRRELLAKISHALEISLKDRGEEIIQTTRATIKALMEEGSKVLVSSDNIGFGALNQGSYEESALNLVEQLNISDAEWQAAWKSPERIATLIDTKYQEVKDNPTFKATVLGIGDEGTEHLRGNEQKLAQLFGGGAIINADGGDESSVLYEVKDNPEIPSDEQELKAVLKAFSDENRVRIAAVLTDMHFSPIDYATRQMAVKIAVEQGKRTVYQEQREEILRYIFGFMAWAEDEHEEIKSLNARGRNRAAVKVDLQKAA